MQPTHHAILQTLAYFEQFKRAWPPEELHSLLWDAEISLRKVHRAVSELAKAGMVVEDGYIALSQQSINETQKRQILLQERRAAALKIAEILSHMPGIVSVILMNSTAMQTLTKESDIDFLIICHPNSLYVSRTRALIALKSKRLVKTRDNQAGKACLGYWLSMNDLAVRRYQTEMHTAAYWIATMVPLYGIEGYRKFVKANKWVYEYLPNWQPHESAHLKEGGTVKAPGSTSRMARRGIGCRVWNNLLYPIHKWKVLWDPEFRHSTELVCELNRLKLHSVDRRPGYGQEMQSILDILLPND